MRKGNRWQARSLTNWHAMRYVCCGHDNNHRTMVIVCMLYHHHCYWRCLRHSHTGSSILTSLCMWTFRLQVRKTEQSGNISTILPHYNELITIILSILFLHWSMYSQNWPILLVQLQKKYTNKTQHCHIRLGLRHVEEWCVSDIFGRLLCKLTTLPRKAGKPVQAAGTVHCVCVCVCGCHK